MPRWLHIIVQIATSAAGIIGAVQSTSTWPLIVSTGINAVIGVINQSYNTDGTPQTVAFIPKQTGK